MTFSWAETKAEARRAVHGIFAVPAVHTEGRPNGQQRICTVRWHVRGNRLMGDLQGQGFAEVIANVDRLAFNAEQLAEAGITRLMRGDTIEIASLGNAKFRLDSQLPDDGPVTQVWEVTPL